uniref:SJCHGC05673 protein n=1 Tax=Schistosoma japonicum TaxID=6182 RepID=Q5DC21_SCHJA|nr:SJCHGC05673 protein [Schistosoma japonicum]
MSVIIIGGGIIGTSTAYYLSKRRIDTLIIEKEQLGSAASGRSGGFLARDWCSHYEMDVLAKNGFDLHMELADEFGSACDYRRVNTYSIALSPGKASSIISESPSWISAKVKSCSLIGNSANTAQVHPRKLTEKLFQRAQHLTNQGTKLKIAHVVGLEFSTSKTPEVTGVRVTDSSNSSKFEVIPASLVILATGPWSKEAVSWLPSGYLDSSKFHGKRAHSIILKPKVENSPIDAKCLFMDYQNSEFSCSPEVYPRPDNTVYVCGLGDGAPVPSSKDSVEIDSWRCNRLKEIVTSVVPSLKDAETVTESACYLPLVTDGYPVIGQIPGLSNVYIATGNSCWGILTGPITGRLLAAIILKDHPNLQQNTASNVTDQMKLDEEKAQYNLLQQPGIESFNPLRLVK